VPIGEQTFTFLRDLETHNRDRAWFEANRTRYEAELLLPMRELAETLAFPLSLILHDVSITPRLSRIYNDLRFHKDKPIFKRHMWLKAGVGQPAELWFAVGPEGWRVGCKVVGPKRSDLHHWRLNLVRHAERFRALLAVLHDAGGVEWEVGDGYKTAVMDGIPADLFDLVQARLAWVMQPRRTSFVQSPEADALFGIAALLPVYLFATVHPPKLLERLGELNDTIAAPYAAIEPIWEAVRSV